MLRKTGLIFIFTIISATAYAQAPDTLWTRNIGMEGHEEAWQLKKTFDGGFVIVGFKETQYPDSSEIYLIKTDENGDTLWTRIYYDSTTDDVGRSVVPLEDRGYIITGHANHQCVLLKTDSLGNEQWRTYLDADYGRAVRSAIEGGYIIAGYKTIPGNTYDMYLAKTDDNGVLLWSRTYGGTYSEMAWDVGETEDWGFVLVGWTTLSDGYSDIYLVRTDPNGDTLWTRTYGNAGNDEARSIIIKDDGGFILAGKLSRDVYYYDAAVIEVDPNGNEVWSDSYIHDGRTIVNSIIPVYNGGLVITGTKIDSNYMFSSFVTELNANGDSLWTRILEDPEQNLYCRSTVQTEDRGYVVAGFHQLPNHANDVFLCKLEPDIVGVRDEMAILPGKIALHQNFPNPFNANTTLSFELTAPGNAILSLYDLLGRKIAVLNEGYFSAGVHITTFNSGDLSSGVYFYNLKAGDISETKSMILLK